MSAQLQIDFTTASPINTVSLTGENKETYEALMRGEKLNLYTAREWHGIGTLHSRISDVIKALGWKKEDIKRKHIKINNKTVCEYWIER